jgi:hypothetical protein
MTFELRLLHRAAKAGVLSSEPLGIDEEAEALVEGQ